MRAMKRSLTATAVAVLVGVAACDTSPTALTGNDAPDALAAALVGGLPAGSNFEVTVCKDENGPGGTYDFTASTTTTGGAVTLPAGASFQLTAGDANLECTLAAEGNGNVTISEVVANLPANATFDKVVLNRFFAGTGTFDQTTESTDPEQTVGFGNDYGWVLVYHNTVTPPPPPMDGRMTGGGSVFMGEVRFTHGFELHCDVNDLPNNLEVNWPDNRFHLTALTSVVCTDDPDLHPLPRKAGFDTYTATGVGLWNGEPGATIEFVFTDDGEPGRRDYATMTITPAGGSAVTVDGYLEKGNHQAHWVN